MRCEENQTHPTGSNSDFLPIANLSPPPLTIGCLHCAFICMLAHTYDHANLTMLSGNFSTLWDNKVKKVQNIHARTEQVPLKVWRTDAMLDNGDGGSSI